MTSPNPFFFSLLIGCEYPEHVGDGICDETLITNNAECNYDGNDCCASYITTSFCTDCICYPSQTCDAPLELIQNGFCNDETNTAECNFDGGDCCLSCINTEHCTICSCHEGGVPEIDLSCKYSFLTKIQNCINKKSEKEILLLPNFCMVVKILGW